LNGDCQYRVNIALAIQRQAVEYLSPFYIPTEDETSDSLLANSADGAIGDLHFFRRDWDSLLPSGMLSDVVLKACGMLIQNEVSNLVAQGARNTGTVYIVDTLFATKVLDEPTGNAYTFIKPEMFRSAKVMIPVVRDLHWCLFVYSQPPYPSCL
jgi:hypothetical protein